MAGQPLLGRQTEQPRGLKQHVQRGEHRPAGDLSHGRYGEGHVPAGLATRGIDQAEVRAVEQDSGRHFGFTEQPLDAGLGARLPVPLVLGVGLVQVGADGVHLDEHHPRLLPFLGLELLDRPGRPECLVVLRQRDFERLRGLVVTAHVH